MNLSVFLIDTKTDQRTTGRSFVLSEVCVRQVQKDPKVKLNVFYAIACRCAITIQSSNKVFESLLYHHVIKSG